MYNKIQKQIHSRYGHPWRSTYNYVSAESLGKPLIVFFGGANDDNNKNMMIVYEAYANANHEKLYFPWTAGPIAAAKITYWQRESRQPVCLVGHSLGGDTAWDVAVDLARKQTNHHASIFLLITLDAVGPSAHFGSQFEKPNNVLHWSNVYVDISKDGCGNTVASFGGHWGEQKAAEENIKDLGSHCNATSMFKKIEHRVAGMMPTDIV